MRGVSVSLTTRVPARTHASRHHHGREHLLLNGRGSMQGHHAPPRSQTRCTPALRARFASLPRPARSPSLPFPATSERHTRRIHQARRQPPARAHHVTRSPIGYDIQHRVHAGGGDSDNSAAPDLSFPPTLLFHSPGRTSDRRAWLPGKRAPRGGPTVFGPPRVSCGRGAGGDARGVSASPEATGSRTRPRRQCGSPVIRTRAGGRGRRRRIMLMHPSATQAQGEGRHAGRGARCRGRRRVLAARPRTPAPSARTAHPWSTTHTPTSDPCPASRPSRRFHHARHTRAVSIGSQTGPCCRRHHHHHRHHRHRPSHHTHTRAHRRV